MAYALHAITPVTARPVLEFSYLIARILASYLNEFLAYDARCDRQVAETRGPASRGWYSKPQKVCNRISLERLASGLREVGIGSIEAGNPLLGKVLASGVAC